MLQAREKFLSLRKGTKSDVASVLEEVLTDIAANHSYCLLPSEVALV